MLAILSWNPRFRDKHSFRWNRKNTNTNSHTQCLLSTRTRNTVKRHRIKLACGIDYDDCGSFFDLIFFIWTRSVRSKSCLVKHNKGVCCSHVWQENTFFASISLWLDLWSNHFISLSINIFPTRFSKRNHFIFASVSVLVRFVSMGFRIVLIIYAMIQWFWIEQT